MRSASEYSCSASRAILCKVDTVSVQRSISAAISLCEMPRPSLSIDHLAVCNSASTASQPFISPNIAKMSSSGHLNVSNILPSCFRGICRVAASMFTSVHAHFLIA